MQYVPCNTSVQRASGEYTVHFGIPTRSLYVAFGVQGIYYFRSTYNNLNVSKYVVSYTKSQIHFHRKLLHIAQVESQIHFHSTSNETMKNFWRGEKNPDHKFQDTVCGKILKRNNFFPETLEVRKDLFVKINRKNIFITKQWWGRFYLKEFNSILL